MKENEANDSGIISVGLFQNVTILPNVPQLILYGLNYLPHHEENYVNRKQRRLSKNKSIVFDSKFNNSAAPRCQIIPYGIFSWNIGI